VEVAIVGLDRKVKRIGDLTESGNAHGKPHLETLVTGFWGNCSGFAKIDRVSGKPIGFWENRAVFEKTE
jgi:hypothetical protein